MRCDSEGCRSCRREPRPRCFRWKHSFISASQRFSLSSITIAHPGVVESLASDLHHQRLAGFGAGKVHIWRLDDSEPRNDCVATLADNNDMLLSPSPSPSSSLTSRLAMTCPCPHPQCTQPASPVDPNEPNAKVKFLAAEALRSVGGLLWTRTVITS